MGTKKRAKLLKYLTIFLIMFSLITITLNTSVVALNIGNLDLGSVQSAEQPDTEGLTVAENEVNPSEISELKAVGEECDNDDECQSGLCYIRHESGLTIKGCACKGGPGEIYSRACPDPDTQYCPRANSRECRDRREAGSFCTDDDECRKGYTCESCKVDCSSDFYLHENICLDSTDNKCKYLEISRNGDLNLKYFSEPDKKYCVPGPSVEGTLLIGEKCIKNEDCMTENCQFVGININGGPEFKCMSNEPGDFGCPEGWYTSDANSPYCNIEKKAVGEECDNDYECISNFCDQGVCSQNEETGSTTEQQGGQEQGSGQEQTGCSSDSDCEDGYCINNECQNLDEIPSLIYQIYSLITGMQDRINDLGVEGVEIQQQGEGASCDDNNDCAPGLTCQSSWFGLIKTCEEAG